MRLQRKIPDYLTDFMASVILCRKIETYWHKQGRLGVKAWVEELQEPKIFVIKTNIVFGALNE